MSFDKAERNCILVVFTNTCFSFEKNFLKDSRSPSCISNINGSFSPSVAILLQACVSCQFSFEHGDFRPGPPRKGQNDHFFGLGSFFEDLMFSIHIASYGRKTIGEGT